MKIHIGKSNVALGVAAGSRAGELIREAIAKNGRANIILATGASQFETLKELVSTEGIQWSQVVMFHLDEYIGMPMTHMASFRKYLKERFVDKVPGLGAAWLINGEADPEAERERLNNIIRRNPIDVALIGIGENSHLAFNDPPADFETNDPYIIIDELDEACRKQQLNEGWFASIDEVPRRAISMSVRQIMKSKHIVCSVPDSRKAIAVQNCLEKPVSNLFPAGILQLHPECDIYLDRNSASLLSGETVQSGHRER